MKIICKKMACILMINALLISVIAGCSGDKSPSRESTGTTLQTSQETSKDEPEVKAEDLKGNVELWHWDTKSVEVALPDFNKNYPDIKVTVVNKPGDYVNNVRISIAAGLDLPDIIMLGAFFRGEVMEWGVLEDLSRPPYNLNPEVFLDYIRPVMYNSGGELNTVPWDLGICGMIYNKDAAKKWLGTDNKAELETILPDWDAFAEVGKQVKEKSGGKAFMFASATPLGNIIFNQDMTPTVIKGKSNFDATIKKTLATLGKIRDAGAIDVIKEWSPAYYASMSADDHIFWVGPTWFPSFTLEPNCIGLSDKFGLMVPPAGGSMSGGGGLGIMSKNKTEQQKLLAWKFIEWFLCSEEGAKIQKEKNNFLIHVKSMYQKPEYAIWKHPLFGEQDLGQVWFKEIADSLKVRPVTPVDRFIFSSQNYAMQRMVENPSTTVDQAYAEFKEQYDKNEPVIKAEN